MRSPILIRWDGVIPAGRHEELVSCIDIVPTLLNLAGVPRENFSEMPGEDLVGELDAGRAVFGAIYPGDATELRRPERDVAYRWVRQGDYKLIVPRGSEAWGDFLSSPALFNVTKDPAEQSNLIGEESSREIVKRLLGLLDDWWKP